MWPRDPPRARASSVLTAGSPSALAPDAPGSIPATSGPTSATCSSGWGSWSRRSRPPPPGAGWRSCIGASGPLWSTPSRSGAQNRLSVATSPTSIRPERRSTSHSWLVPSPARSSTSGVRRRRRRCRRSWTTAGPSPTTTRSAATTWRGCGTRWASSASSCCAVHPAAEQEERRPDPEPVEHVEEPGRGQRMRPVVEGQRDMAGIPEARQPRYAG